MKISKQHLHIGNKRRGIKTKMTKITIHSTGNPKSTAQNERDWLDNPENTSSTGYHYVVGEDIVIEVAPPNEVMYHAGNKTGNHTSIGIEMVETGNREKVIDNTIKLIKSLQSQFGVYDDNVVRHYDWTKKNCPRILNYNNWQGWVEFKALLRKGDNMTKEEVISIVKEEVEKIRKEDEAKRSKENISTYAKESWEKSIQLKVNDGVGAKNYVTEEQLMVFFDRLGLFNK